MADTVPVSTIGDLFRLVGAAFNALGDGTPLLIGRKYLAEFGAGSAPRVLFVPEEQGRLGRPTRLNAGELASYTHGCQVYVRGAESGDDAGRFDAVYALADRVINALKWCDPAHVVLEPGNPRDASPLPDDAYGADVVFSFVFIRPIAIEREIHRLPVEALSPMDPDRPRGDSGKTFVLSAPASAER